MKKMHVKAHWRCCSDLRHCLVAVLSKANAAVVVADAVEVDIVVEVAAVSVDLVARFSSTPLPILRFDANDALQATIVVLVMMRDANPDPLLVIIGFG